MSEFDESTLRAIQPSDTTDTGTAVRNIISKRIREEAWRQRREASADIRKLMRSAEAAFAGESDHTPHEILDPLQQYLENDPKLHDVLDPTYEALDDKYKMLFRRLSRCRQRWREGDDIQLPLLQEYETYVRVAIAIGAVHAGSDKTRYAPVYLPKLTVRGARSPVGGDPTPVGRVRIGADSTVELGDRETTIPHLDCEHVMVIANPREGKDALISRIAGNLKDEHGYKWVALHDDGRNETPMIATPNDEEAIIESLESFGQTPKGYQTEVFVPAVGLLDELPRNHVLFTVGVDSLTPEIITQLSGVTPEGQTLERIKYAVEECSGSVDRLVRLLEKYAEETSAEVTVTELRDADEMESEEVSSTTRSYDLGEDQILKDCAQSLMLLASEGLLRDAGTETNLDMTEVLENQDAVAVLNCNFLPDGDEHLKYLLENVWLRLINEERDRNPWLPRVAIEIREIKELAPSTLTRSKYTNIVKSLRQTLFHLSSQGGSRRIMLLGSTQYLRDVYLPVRGNMPIKILLKMGEEKISVLESAGFDFTPSARDQLKSFDTGWGMIMMPDGKTYPVNWAGPRCALGLGDLEWLDRYGLAMGFRVQHDSMSAEDWQHDDGTYFDRNGQCRAAPPDRQEWYLLEEDVNAIGADGDADGLEEEAVLDAARERQEWPVPQDLRPKPVDVTTEQRELNLLSTAEKEEKEENSVYEKFEITGALRDWTRRQEGTVERFLDILEAVEVIEASTYADIADACSVPQGSIKAYSNDESQLANCIEKKDGAYQLKPLGKKSLRISWGAVFEEL